MKKYSKIRISIAITVLNEESNIRSLLSSLLTQSLVPDEILIVDGGSTDNTVEIIKEIQKNNRIVKLIRKTGNIAIGRNTAIKNAKYGVIAQIDAGCIAKRNWLAVITKPFKNKKAMVVAGFYEMISRSCFEKAAACYLGVSKANYDNNTFLPSGRSMAFRKSVWRKIGGYAERLNMAGEDTEFNYKIVKAGIKIIRRPNALVYWQSPHSIGSFMRKLFFYAKGDAETMIWWHPAKGAKTHNVKILLIFARYILGLTLLLLSLERHYLAIILTICFLLYLYWSYWKMSLILTDRRARLYAPVIQICSDLAVMAGFIAGTIGL